MSREVSFGGGEEGGELGGDGIVVGYNAAMLEGGSCLMMRLNMILILLRDGGGLLNFGFEGLRMKSLKVCVCRGEENNISSFCSTVFVPPFQDRVLRSAQPRSTVRRRTPKES